MLIRSLFYRRLAVVPSGPLTEILIVAGQSNAQSWSGPDGGRGYPAGVMEYNQAGQLVQAQNRLVHLTNQGPQDSIGPAIEFAHSYMTAFPDNTLIIVPCAAPGTGFGQGDWNKGDPMYEAARARINAAALLPDVDGIYGMMWVHGERDARLIANPDDAANYAANFDQFYADFVADVPALAGVPWVLGGMVPEWVAQDADRQIVQAAIAAAPDRNAGLVYVDPVGLSGVVGDVIHYDAASQRVLGVRYFEAINGAPVQVPDWVISGTTIEQSPGGVSQPSVTGYIVG